MQRLATFTALLPPAALLLTFLAAHPALASGPVIGWGSQSTPPDAVNGTAGTASAIAAGALHSLAIQAGTGNAVCWGDDYYGQASPPPEVDGTTGTASAIAGGHEHS